MSSIKKGDLVMVVRAAPCCGNVDGLGGISRVAYAHVPMFGCSYCNDETEWDCVLDEDGNGRRITRLRRLNPDALKDDIPQRDEVPA